MQSASDALGQNLQRKPQLPTRPQPETLEDELRLQLRLAAPPGAQCTGDQSRGRRAETSEERRLLQTLAEEELRPTLLRRSQVLGQSCS